jgi:hypothetical protein
MIEKNIQIRDIGGVAAFDLTLRPGVTELIGRNGAGKTSTMSAVSRLFGAEVPLEPRDGSESGEVVGEGVKLVVRKVCRATGQADVALADTGPLATLIDPGLKDPEARAKARIRALVALLRLPVTDEAILTLAADALVAKVATQEIHDEMIEDLLQACEKVRLVAHRLKREQDQERDEAHGRAEVHEAAAAQARREALAAGGPVDLTMNQARELASAAESEYHTARVTCQQRQELERQQAEIRESLGERPDLSAHDATLARLDGEVDAAQEAVRAAEQVLYEARGLLESAKSVAALERQERVKTLAALEAHKRQSAILDREVSGATPDEVARLELEVTAFKSTVERARLSEAISAAQKKADAEARKAAEHGERAEYLEAIAKSVRTRLGDLLAGSPAAGLTIDRGRLAVLDDDGKAQDFESRQSDGQRIRVALQIAKVAYKGAVVPLDGRYWTALDGERQSEFARAAEEAGLYVLTERPTEGPLAARHVAVSAEVEA